MKLETPHLKAIAAMASNRVIGRDGKLPWHLPEDLKWFKRCTLDHPILMGRKTFDSLPGILPRRRHLVVSRTLAPGTDLPEGVEVIGSLEALNELGIEGDVFVIGGANLYEQLLPMCSDLYLSFVFEPHEGDTFFPAFEDDFELKDVMEKHDAFELRHYVRKEGNALSFP